MITTVIIKGCPLIPRKQGAKPTRIVREGCGSSEPGVCSFVFGYPPSKRQCPPSPGLRWDTIPALGPALKTVFFSLFDSLYPLNAKQFP